MDLLAAGRAVEADAGEAQHLAEVHRRPALVLAKGLVDERVISRNGSSNLDVKHKGTSTIMRPISPQRFYRVQHNIHYFYAGYLENGNQILMGVQLPELVSVEFDADGNYLEMAVKEIAWAKQRPSGFDEEKLSVELQAWQSEMGLTPATISVKRFFLPDRWIGIKDLPDYCQEALDRPVDYDEERLREIQEDVRQWRESGDFVLYWNEDYYLSQEGEVVGS